MMGSKAEHFAEGFWPLADTRKSLNPNRIRAER
jgi:hypothetical protein